MPKKPNIKKEIKGLKKTMPKGWLMESNVDHFEITDAHRDASVSFAIGTSYQEKGEAFVNMRIMTFKANIYGKLAQDFVERVKNLMEKHGWFYKGGRLANFIYVGAGLRAEEILEFKKTIYPVLLGKHVSEFFYAIRDIPNKKSMACNAGITILMIAIANGIYWLFDRFFL